MNYPINSVGIIGSGTMAIGIGKACIKAGYDILIYSLNTDRHNEVKQIFSLALEKVIRIKDKDVRVYDFDKKIKITAVLDFMAEVDIIIETTTEDYKVKSGILNQLDSAVAPTSPIFSNTSSLSIDQLSLSLKRPERFMGMHFINPAEVMELVELVKGKKTDERTVSIAKSFVISLNKDFIILDNSPGFVVNRLLLLLINEAIHILEEETLTVEEIDKAMVMGAKHRLGPLAIADMIGLDICLQALKNIHNMVGGNKYKPCYLLNKYIQKGFLGRKAKQGFYHYD